ncbi:hypothetical protein [Ancylomarina longa]|uniref:Phosphotyrosine protein phosphatase I domain-containing protein n=1 Tax=Ancylomarina longa TaxID=2487017 RepID=A0A434AEZ7_9BACT|nr:hypothetical protein [Ancylomarina longa]RUT72957.1 hypothetical protein DLK05_15800 [Ancylomarina longa]
MKKLLVISRKNEARSQMAEKWFKYYGKNHLKVWSGGLEKGNIQLLAQKAMTEAVMDIPDYKAKLFSELEEDKFDFVICFDKSIVDELPKFSGTPEIVSFDTPDPSEVEGEELVRLQAYNAVCNVIEDLCFAFVQEKFQIIS